MGVVVLAFFLFAAIILIAGLSKANKPGNRYRGGSHSSRGIQNGSNFNNGFMYNNIMNNDGYIPDVSGKSSYDSYGGESGSDSCNDSGSDCSSGDSGHDSGASDCGCDCSSDSGSSCSSD